MRTVRLLLLIAGGGFELLRERPAARRQRAEWLHRICARAMQQLGIDVEIHGRFPARGSVISNHTGYLDIISFAAKAPCVFVSKAEIRSWPVLGWMTTMSGTIYVERGRGGSAARATKQLEEPPRAELPVVFFPEGTTTNGQQLLPFRSGVLHAVMLAGESVTAASVTYSLGEGNGSATVRDDVAYWGDVLLAKHVFRLLGLRNVSVSVRFADAPIVFSEAARADRKVAAAEARAAVLELRADVLGVPDDRTALSGQERSGA